METYTRMVGFEYPDVLPDVQPGTSHVAHAWAKVSLVLPCEEHDDLEAHIKRLLKEHEAVLVAHYYVDAGLQDLAEEIGGCVFDSLEMVRFGRDHSAKTLTVVGICFMGETAKILSPGKTVLMPDLDVTCSLDLGCLPDELAASCDAHPDRTVIVYANTGAIVKARADRMVISSIGLKIMQYLHMQGRKILWVPNRHLDSYTQKQTGTNMPMWQGSCPVHDELRGVEPDLLRAEYPNAKVLVHPRSPELVAAQADVVGSTSQPITAAQSLSAQELVITTDNGILRKMHMAAPGEHFIEVPTAGNVVTCRGCVHCPWMAMSTLASLTEVLETGRNEIHVDPTVR